MVMFPFNRIGGTRGPNGTTLDDLLQALFNAGDLLQQLITQGQANGLLLAQLSSDLRRLVGEPVNDPATWRGLPAELGVSPTSSGETLADRLFALVLLGSNVEGNTSVSADRLQNILTQLTALRGAPAASLAELLAVLNASDGRLNQLVGLNNEQSAVLGFIGDEPAGKSVKALLADQLACCEGDDPGGGGDPNNPENEPPEGFGCPNGLRATGWYKVFETVTPQQQTITRWHPIFPALAGFNTVGGTSDAQRQGYNLSGDPAARDICISWNFANNQRVPTGFGRNRAGSIAGSVDDNSVNGPLGGSATLEVGGLTDELRRCVPSDDDDDYVSYVFEVTGTTAPALNVWLSKIDRSCAV